MGPLEISWDWAVELMSILYLVRYTFYSSYTVYMVNLIQMLKLRRTLPPVGLQWVKS